MYPLPIGNDSVIFRTGLIFFCQSTRHSLNISWFRKIDCSFEAYYLSLANNRSKTICCKPREQHPLNGVQAIDSTLSEKRESSCQSTRGRTVKEKNFKRKTLGLATLFRIEFDFFLIFSMTPRLQGVAFLGRTERIPFWKFGLFGSTSWVNRWIDRIPRPAGPAAAGRAGETIRRSATDQS